MDAKSFLQDMLSEGRSLLEQGAAVADKGAAYAAEKMGAGQGAENHELYKTITKGAVGAGAVALALGTRSGGALARLGGLAALGTIAYKAYQKGSGGAAAADGSAIGEADGPDAERRARTLLKAMIAGARADGAIDPAERAMIEEKLAGLGEDAQGFFMEELMKPLDAGALAAEAQSPQEAREIYAAAALACGRTTADERAFLSQLARALNLPEAVAAEIAAQADAA